METENKKFWGIGQHVMHMRGDPDDREKQKNQAMHIANMRFTMQVEKAKSYETDKLFEIEEHRLAEVRRQNEIARRRTQDC